MRTWPSGTPITVSVSRAVPSRSRSLSMCRSCDVQTAIRTVTECRPPQHYAAGQARIVHGSRRAASAHTQLRMKFEHPTSNAQRPSARANRAGDLDVGRSALDVGRSSVHAWPNSARANRAGDLDIGRSALDVGRSSVHAWPNSARANRAGDLDVGRSALDVGRSSVHAWPNRSLSEPIRLLFPIRRARGAHGRILLQNIGLRTR